MAVKVENLLSDTEVKDCKYNIKASVDLPHVDAPTMPQAVSDPIYGSIPISPVSAAAKASSERDVHFSVISDHLLASFPGNVPNTYTSIALNYDARSVGYRVDAAFLSSVIPAGRAIHDMRITFDQLAPGGGLNVFVEPIIYFPSRLSNDPYIVRLWEVVAQGRRFNTTINDGCSRHFNWFIDNCAELNTPLGRRTFVDFGTPTHPIVPFELVVFSRPLVSNGGNLL